MKSFANMYVKGLLNEQRAKPHLEKVWGKMEKLHSTHTFDFDGGSFFVEIKSRENEYLKYPTTLLPYHKTQEMEHYPGKKLYCVFIFTDGTYYIEYDKSVFDTFQVEQNFVCHKRQDKIDRPSPHIHIPICRLTKLY